MAPAGSKYNRIQVHGNHYKLILKKIILRDSELWIKPHQANRESVEDSIFYKD